MYKHFFKRIFDFIIAFTVFVLAFPILLPLTILLAISNQGNPFFFQSRPGKNGNLFKIIKLKTMNDLKDQHGNLLPDAERLTKMGQFIRKTSLDEIPQLINVIMGDMSLIGPRPLLVEYLLLYNDFQQRRHEVRPGITGWAQVNGRNAISWDEKFKLDVYYVDHINFLFDLGIVFKTVKKVLVKDGISSDTSVTMEKFKGN